MGHRHLSNCGREGYISVSFIFLDLFGFEPFLSVFVNFSGFCWFFSNLVIFMDFCRLVNFIRLQTVFVVKWIHFGIIYSSRILKTALPCSRRDSNSRTRGPSYICYLVWIKWGIWSGRNRLRLDSMIPTANFWNTAEEKLDFVAELMWQRRPRKIENWRGRSWRSAATPTGPKGRLNFVDNICSQGPRQTRPGCLFLSSLSFPIGFRSVRSPI